jgi:PKD repeat protein
VLTQRLAPGVVLVSLVVVIAAAPALGGGPVKAAAPNPDTWDAVADGSFELGSPNPYWVESSTYGAPVIRDTPTRAHQGQWFALCGHATPTDGQSSVEQIVSLGRLQASLSFYLKIPARSGNGFDKLRVLLDGVEVMVVGEGTTAFGLLYEQAFVDLGAHPEGEEHVLRFECQTSAAGGPTGTEFLIDDVSLMTADEPLNADFEWTPLSPSTGEEVAFHDLSTGQPDAWSWDLGDGVWSYEQHPVHTYNAPGTFTVVLEVTRGGTESSTEVKQIVVEAPLVADFGWSPYYPQVGEGVQFSDVSGGAPQWWWWDFGDGATSQLRHPVHAFDASGAYEVSLTIGRSGSGVTATTSRTVVVGGEELVAAFSWTPDNPAPGEQVHFTDMSAGNPASWQWDFGDGAGSNEPNPVHAYGEAGDFGVSLSISDASGSQHDETTAVIHVGVSGVLADFRWQPEFPKPANDVHFIDLSQGDVQWWQWSFGDGGQSAEPSPIHQYLDPGGYDVTLTVGGPGSPESTATRHLIVELGLEADFVWSPEDPVAGELVHFVDVTPAECSAWSWDFGDGSGSDEQNPSHIFPAPGPYEVRLTVTLDQGGVTVDRSATRMLVIGEALRAEFSWSPGVGTPGGEVRFSDASVGSPWRWEWSFGDGAESDQPSPVHVFAELGEYLVTLAVTGAGTTSSVAHVVVVAEGFWVDFQWTPDPPRAGELVHFTDLSSGGVTGWLWWFGDGDISEEANPTHIYADPGVYAVMLTVVDDTGHDYRLERPLAVMVPDNRIDVALSNPRPQIGEPVGFEIRGVDEIEGATFELGGPGCGGAEPFIHCVPDVTGCRHAEYRYATPGVKTAVVWVELGGEQLGPFMREIVVAPGGSCEEIPIADFEWWPQAPRERELVRFSDRSSGPPIAWHWDFGDGGASSDPHPEHEFATPGSYPVTLTATGALGQSQPRTIIVEVASGAPQCGDGRCEGEERIWSCPEDCALPAGESGRAGAAHRQPVVPAAAGGVGGVGGTFWLTEGMIFNPGNTERAFVLEFSPDSHPAQIVSAGPIVLQPERAVFFDNLVQELFATTENGSVWLDSDGPIMVDTRTYNLTDLGTYGQAICGIRRQSLLAEGDGAVFLIGLAENGRFRSNILIQEVSGQDAAATINVYQDDGLCLETRQLAVPGHSKKQQRLSQLGVTNLDRGYATIEVGGPGRIAAIASVIDETSGDATTIDAVHPSQVMPPGPGKDGAEVHYLVAVVARTPGVNDSLWRSELAIQNPGDGDQALRLVYRTSGVAALEATASVAATELFFSEDVVGELFSTAPTGSGALHVYAPAGVIVSSRTYNVAGDGSTFGQSIPGLGEGDMARPGEVWVLNKLKNTSDFRCNVGFSEFSGESTEVRVVLFDVSGASRRALRSKTYSVPAFESRQVARIFQDMGVTGEYREAMAYVMVSGDEGSVYVYASIVDNELGDATTVLAKRKGE